MFFSRFMSQNFLWLTWVKKTILVLFGKKKNLSINWQKITLVWLIKKITSNINNNKELQQTFMSKYLVIIFKNQSLHPTLLMLRGRERKKIFVYNKYNLKIIPTKINNKKS